MKNRTLRALFASFALLMIIGTAACNTMEGAGEDMEGAGEAVQDEAQ